MSDENLDNGVGDAETPNGGADSGADKVAYETYSRTLDQKKSVEKENEKLRADLEAMKAMKAEAEGDKDSALESWKERALKAEQNEKTLKTSVATEKVENNVKKALLEAGCKKPETALRIMDDKDYNTLLSDVGDNFIVNEQTMNFVIDKLKRQTAEINLFGRPAPKVVDGVPASGEVGKPKTTKELALKKVSEAKTPEEYEKALDEAMKHF